MSIREEDIFKFIYDDEESPIKEEEPSEPLQYHDDNSEESADSEDEGILLLTSGPLKRRLTASSEDIHANSQKLEQTSTPVPSTLRENENDNKPTMRKRKLIGKHKDEQTRPEICGDAKTASSPFDYWSLLFTDTIIDLIVKHTNEELGKGTPKYSNNRETDRMEIKALIGLLYLRGTLKLTKPELWNNYKIPYFKATANIIRFTVLVPSLRFGDTIQSNEYGKLSEIIGTWEIFTENCQKYYSPSKNCTIGKQKLYSVHYTSDAPETYHRKDIQIVMMNDSKNRYMLNAMLHTSQRFCAKLHNNPDYYVEQLSKKIHKSPRNITTDDWFTSKPILKKMLIDYQVTMIGTIREQVPPSKVSKQSTQQIKENGKTLLTYVKFEEVTLLSSLDQTHTEEKKTAAIVTATYKETKEATNSFDALCRRHTVARKVAHSRCLLRVFYIMLDQACVNSLILYNLNNSNQPLSHLSFLYALSHSLIEPFLKFKRSNQIYSLRKDVLRYMNEIIKPEISHQEGPRKFPKARRCTACKGNGKRTKIGCSRCTRSNCKEHRRNKCIDCVCK